MATQNERAVIDLVVNGKQSETSLKQIATAAVDARKKLSLMAETDPGYKKQKTELEALMRAQQARIVKIHDEMTAWQKFKANAGGVAAGIVGGNLIETGFRAIGSAISSAIQNYRAFEAASQELSAVTGMVGRDLEYLNRQAAKTGPAVGKSGAEMLEAYKLMGSAKPELLANKELLVETTKAAITLSQAGMIELSTATSVTAESLNQFGEGADQANRFVNVIAAGAKEGSAEINEMGAALKNSGTVAAAQNVSFEETNAILQSMSTIALKGGEAGTQLRNVLLTMGSGADDTNPKVVGLEKALENLGKKNLSTAELTKLFGKENITAAQHIISHRTEIGALTTKLTGTNEAFTQAAKNNATFDHQMAKFAATMKGLAVIIGTAVLPAINRFLEIGTNVAQFLTGSMTPASEQATQAFEDQKTTVQNLQRTFVPLLDRHDELKKKTVLTKDEQAELDRIVQQVADTVPSAVTEFDKYGKALSVNTEKAREFIKMQRLMLKEKNQDAIRTNTDALKEEERQLQINIAKRKSGRIQERDATSFGGGYTSRQMTEAELRELDQANADLKSKIDDRRLLMQGLSGEYLNEPGTPSSTKPSKPAGGGSNAGDSVETKEEKAANRKREKAEREREREAKAVERQEDQLETLMEAARARTEQFQGDAYTKEQIQFGDHYAKLYELAGDNKDKMAEITALMYQELEAINQKEQERQAKAAEEQKEKDAQKKKEEYDAAAEQLDLQYEQERALYEPLEAELAKTDEDKKLYALEREEKYLVARQLLAQTYGQGIVDVEAKITDNHVAQAELRRDAHTRTTEQMKQATWSMIEAYSSAMDQGATALKLFLTKGTIAYKAVIVAQKAAAIAQVVIDTQREIRQVWANPTWSAMPDAGATLKTAYSVAAGIRAAASIATIAKQGAGEMAEKDDGGYTGVSDLYGSPAGYYARPTRVNAGRRSYMMAEKRKEFIMGGAMLENPVMANIAGALNALQVTGEYRNLRPGSPAGGGASGGAGSAGGLSDALLMRMIEEQTATRQALQQYANRPMVYDYFKARDQKDYVDEIDTETKL